MRLLRMFLSRNATNCPWGLETLTIDPDLRNLNPEPEALNLEPENTVGPCGARPALGCKQLGFGDC